MAGLFDKIHALKVQLKEVLIQKSHVEAGAHGNLHASRVELAPRDDLFSDGLGVGDHNNRLVAAKPVQNLCAQSDVGVVGLVAVGVGAAVGIRKKQHRPLREKFFEVVQKVRGLFFVAAQHDDGLLEFSEGRGGH